MKVTRLLPPLLLILASAGLAPAIWATDKLTSPRLTPDQWQATDQLDHPLLGSIWSLPTGGISAADLLDSLPRGGWLLLGEQHDHPDHHRIQVTLLKTLAQQGRLGAVAFEMLNTEQQPLLDQWLGRGDEVTPEDLDWNPGWPWERYEQQVRSALNLAERVVAADLPRALQRKAYTEGAPAGALDAAHSEFMKELLFTSHCGKLPREHLGQMLQVQLARDQQMTDALAQHVYPQRTGVLITGAVHARQAIGVPRWIEPELPHLSLLLSSLDHKTDASAYLPNSLELDVSEREFLLFTAALPEQDHCADISP
ncbi:ChaN family lipoprotein [Nitrincola sp. MINF-07-Sa-05]|uniref:ChaN family lipoprotein n=1 Tax=Nitrincola salilacus TaxID=3400273 RepID=UPI003917BEE3